MLEITRAVLGHIGGASHEGCIKQLGRHEGWLTDGVPVWWNWYNWPYWWYHLNSIGQVKWQVELATGESMDLEYQWHYFWRM